jgi:glutathione S-transferase
MITIYHLGVSQSDRIVWLAEELGLDYRIEWFHREPSMVAPDALKAIHPMGRAPVIRDGELLLAESGAIVQYLIEHHGEGRLAVPAGAPNHADYLFWFHFAGSSFMPLVMVDMVSRGRDGDAALSGHFSRQLDTAYRLIEDRLAKAPYFAGEHLSAADIMMAFPLTTMARFGGRDLGDYPAISAYGARLNERPAYARAMAVAGPDKP